MENNIIKIPIYIVCYNNGIYVENTVKQLKNKNIPCDQINIINNNSTGKETIEILSNLSKSYNIINTESNLGHKVWTNPFIWDTLPEYFIVTDPDLEYNDQLPVNFIDILYEISNLYNIPKTGFALNIEAPDIFNQHDYAEGRYNIKEWESRFWTKPVGKYKNLELYEADIDTTFFLGRKSKFTNDYYTNTRNIRVASNFTCKHLPWHIEHNNTLNRSTLLELYSGNDISTTCKIIRNYYKF